MYINLPICLPIWKPRTVFPSWQSVFEFEFIYALSLVTWSFDRVAEITSPAANGTSEYIKKQVHIVNIWVGGAANCCSHFAPPTQSETEHAQLCWRCVMGVVSLNTIGSRKHSYGHIGSAVLLGGIPQQQARSRSFSLVSWTT